MHLQTSNPTLLLVTEPALCSRPGAALLNVGASRLKSRETPLSVSILASQRIDRDLILSYWDEMLAISPDEMQARIDHEMKAISVPVLAVFGQTIDAITREHLLGAMPSVEIEEWAGLGHMVHLMKPDRFARRIAEFSERCFSLLP